jgi:hypothetical protein
MYLPLVSYPKSWGSSCLAVTLIAVLAAAPLAGHSHDADDWATTVRGRITDANGNSLGKAEVRVLDSTGKVVAEGVTDSAGHYRLSGITAWPYVVEARLQGFPTERVRVERRDPGLVVDIGLSTPAVEERFSTVQGEVFDPSGHPIADATITIAPVLAQLARYQLRTDKKGQFTVTVPEGGIHFIGAVKEGFVPDGRLLQITLARTSAPHIAVKLQLQPCSPCAP